ncbi:AAA family ATPase [Amycolatopsis sp. NPDC051061]|uniref:helix-turn-helix transcriptional regulator n=1 Tax=Amycolatopsis sp. NPDC051061 TaxID=3155042 RepID=UPI003421BD11
MSNRIPPDITLDVKRLAEVPLGRAGRAVLVDGPPACGKTTVVRQIVGRAVAVGYVAATATCAHTERKLPFGVLSQLAYGSGRGREGDPDIEALSELFTATAVPTDEAELLQLCHRLCNAIIAISERVPLVIAVDDVRRGDVPSLHVLLQLIRRLDSARVLVVFSDDLRLPATFLPLRYELLRLHDLHRVQVGPLTVGQVSSRVGGELGVGALDRTNFMGFTGGNPLLLDALLTDLSEAGEPRELGYGHAFLSCLHRNEPIFLDAVRAMAVFGPAAPAELSRVAGHELGQISQVLAALEDCGLLAESGFRHEVARQAVLADTPATEQEILHRRAARLLRDRGGTATAITGHLLLAGRITDPWSADMLLEAAEQALPRNELVAAVELLHRALDCCPDRDRRIAIQARLVSTEWRINPSTAARHLSAMLSAFRAEQLPVQDALMLVKNLLWHGRMADAESILSQLRSNSAATELMPSFEQWLTCTYAGLARPRTVQHRHTDSLLTRVELWPQAVEVLTDVLVAGHTEDIVRRAEAVLRERQLAHGLSGRPDALIFALFSLIYSDRSETASVWCETLLADPGVRHGPMLHAALMLTAAECALRRGDHLKAAELVTETFALVSPGGWGVHVGLPLSIRILALTRMGRLEEARAAVGQPVPDAMFTDRHGLHYLYSRGYFFLAVGRYQAALGDFLLCGELLTRWGLGGGCAPVPWRTAAAEAWLALGNRDQTRTLIHEQLSRPGTDSARARGQALRLLAQTSAAKRRPRLLNEAASLCESVDDKYELARALHDLAQAQRALGENKLARRVTRRAWRVAKMCDAAPLCDDLMPVGGDVIDSELLPKQQYGIDQLTHSEHRVAALASAGMTNREIADRLFVTQSTVEQHLTRVFRKLGIKQREQLPPELAVDRSKSA